MEPFRVFPAVDDWLNSDSPTIEEVVARLRDLRLLASDIRIADAHLVSYVREELGLGDLDDDPPFLDPEATERDDWTTGEQQS